MSRLSRRTLLAAGLAAGVATATGIVPARAARAPAASRDWPRNGRDLSNNSFNPYEDDIGRDNVSSLELQWTTAASGPVQNTPVIAGGRLYYGSWEHELICADAGSGETLWKFSPPGNERLSAYEQGIRCAPQVADGRVYFTDSFTRVHCLDADSGQALWDKQLDTDAVAHLAHARFSPALFEDRLVVAHGGAQPQIACLDANDGTILWRFYTGRGGTPWTSAAIDPEERVVYNVTGDPKAIRPGDPMLYSNCMLANDLDTGALHWYRQADAQDAHNLDFSGHPMLFDAKGQLGATRECVGAGNKRGFFVYDRHTGEPLWRASVTAPHQAGGPLASSTAVAYNRVFMTSNAYSPGKPIQSVSCALHAYSGDIEWWVQNPAMTACNMAVANGVVFTGHGDGLLQGLDAQTGARLWEYQLPSTCRGIAIADSVLYASHGEIYVVRGKGLPEGYAVHAFTIGGRG